MFMSIIFCFLESIGKFTYPMHFQKTGTKDKESEFT
jgi:hypothetical protein